MALSWKSFVNVPGILADLRSFNFSVYGRWFGYINILLCLALGIANIFHFSIVIGFAIVAIVQGLLLIFVEVPILLKICPLSDNFIGFVKKCDTNGRRTVLYTALAIVQYASLSVQVTSLLVVAIGLTISAIFYGTGYLKKQEFLEGNVIRNPTDPSFMREAAVREVL
ncbi:AaceriAGL072Wp [[Ashbya] aceris (nom. inval.)]|nr:AaceriAGL072Wp [[Ashbya] aceris (nom. inval.)]